VLLRALQQNVSGWHLLKTTNHLETNGFLPGQPTRSPDFQGCRLGRDEVKDG